MGRAILETPINRNPATGEQLLSPAFTSQDETDLAIERAEQAFHVWSKKTPLERSRILRKAAQLLHLRNSAIAEQETRDTGKPFSETSTVDVQTGAEVLEYFANLAAGGGLNGEQIQLRANARITTTKEPLGVCVGIGAWNYPIQIALWKSAPCLAAGNVMIYKPSEFTPLHAATLSGIYREAGLPPNVFQPIYGDGVIGSYLTSHPTIVKVSFTGQVSTGKRVAAAAAAGLRHITMELGGKSPLIILPDVDIAQAVDGAMMANFFSTGQVCTNGTRVFVPIALKAQFETQLLLKMSNIRMGDPMHPDTNFGPLVSLTHWEKVTSLIKYGKLSDRARCIYPVQALERPEGFDGGYWVQPTIFTDCTDDMRIVSEEIFGPVMTILTYETVDEAVDRANDTRFGLAAGVFGRDATLAEQVVRKLEAGICWVNTWGESPAEMCVGGWKDSGLGVENGKRGLEEWLRSRSILVEGCGKVATVFAPVAAP